MANKNKKHIKQRGDEETAVLAAAFGSKNVTGPNPGSQRVNNGNKTHPDATANSLVNKQVIQNSMVEAGKSIKRKCVGFLSRIFGSFERFMDWYNLQLDKYPFETNAISTGLIGSFSDLLRQVIEYYLSLKTAQNVSAVGPKTDRTLGGSATKGLMQSTSPSDNGAIKGVQDLAKTFQAKATQRHMSTKLRNWLIEKIRAVVPLKFKQLAGGFYERFQTKTVLEQYLLGFAILHPVCYVFFEKLEEFFEDEDHDDLQLVHLPSSGNYRTSSSSSGGPLPGAPSPRSEESSDAGAVKQNVATVLKYFLGPAESKKRSSKGYYCPAEILENLSEWLVIPGGRKAKAFVRGNQLTLASSNESRQLQLRNRYTITYGERPCSITEENTDQNRATIPKDFGSGQRSSRSDLSDLFHGGLEKANTVGTPPGKGDPGETVGGGKMQLKPQSEAPTPANTKVPAEGDKLKSPNVGAVPNAAAIKPAAQASPATPSSVFSTGSALSAASRESHSGQLVTENTEDKLRRFWQAFKKVTAEELLFAPLFNMVFMIAEGVLQGETVYETIVGYREKFWDIQTSNMIFWYPINLLNFYVMPPKSRLLFANAMNIIWMVYLSMKSK